MSYNLYLDDLRFPVETKDLINLKTVWNSKADLYENNEDWFIVRNFDEFVQAIQSKGIPNKISFDHDLYPEHYTPSEFWSDYAKSKQWQDEKRKTYVEKTGLDAARWLINYVLVSSKYVDSEFTEFKFPEIFIHSQNEVGADYIEFLFRAFFKMYPQYSTTVKNVIEHIYTISSRK